MIKYWIGKESDPLISITFQNVWVIVILLLLWLIVLPYLRGFIPKRKKTKSDSAIFKTKRNYNDGAPTVPRDQVAPPPKPRK